MTLLRFDPFRSFEHTARKMQRIINDLDKNVSFEGSTFKPRVDISEDSKNVWVTAEMPGISKENIKVQINDENVLFIRGEKKSNYGENATMHRTERCFGNFERSFILPENLDVDKITAKYDNGTLELNIPKIEPPKPREVEVNII